MYLIPFIYKEVVYNGHLQSLGAASIMFVSSAFFLIDYNIHIIISTYLLFQSIYMFDRYKDLHKDYFTNKERVKHIKTYSSFIPKLLILMVVNMVAMIGFFSNMTALLFSIFILILGFLYPIYFKQLTIHIFLFKNLYVSLVFGILVVYFFIYNGLPIQISLMLIILIIMVFFETLINQILLDTKDTVSDSKANLLTLPAIFGNDKSIKILYISNALLFTSMLFFYKFFSLVTAFFAIILFNFILNNLSINLVSNTNKRGYIISILKFSLWTPIIVVVTMFL